MSDPVCVSAAAKLIALPIAWLLTLAGCGGSSKSPETTSKPHAAISDQEICTNLLGVYVIGYFDSNDPSEIIGEYGALSGVLEWANSEYVRFYGLRSESGRDAALDIVWEDMWDFCSDPANQALILG